MVVNTKSRAQFLHPAPDVYPDRWEYIDDDTYVRKRFASVLLRCKDDEAVVEDLGQQWSDLIPIQAPEPASQAR